MSEGDFRQGGMNASHLLNGFPHCSCFGENRFAAGRAAAKHLRGPFMRQQGAFHGFGAHAAVQVFIQQNQQAVGSAAGLGQGIAPNLGITHGDG